MKMLQLDPPIPVVVVKGSLAGQNWPEGRGYAVGWIDYSQEHFTLWKVAMDHDGVIWDIPQSEVRLQKNPSMGRTAAACDLEASLARAARGVGGDIEAELAKSVAADWAALLRLKGENRSANDPKMLAEAFLTNSCPPDTISEIETKLAILRAKRLNISFPVYTIDGIKDEAKAEAAFITANPGYYK